MVFLPIVERELRRATRRRGTYWTRGGAALGSFLLAAWMILTMESTIVPEELGTRLFQTLTLLAFVGGLLSGVLLTADSLSEDKRSGTLGLLFLTDLNGYDVVLGKMFASSLHAFYALLAMLPAMAVPFFLGGITHGEFWRMAALLTTTLILSLSIGIFISTVSWHEHKALIGTAALVLAVAVGLHVAGQPLSALSPVSAYTLAGDKAYTAEPERFLGAMLSQLGLCGLMLVGACLKVRQSWREPVTLQTGGAGRPVVQADAARTIRAADPMRWLARKTEHRGWIWGSLALISVSLFLLDAGQKPFTAVVWMLALHLTLQFWIAWEAGHRLNQERREGNLEIILTTPIGHREIVQSHLHSLKSEFLPPVIAVVLCDLLLMLRAAFRTTDAVDLVTVSISIMLVLAVNLYAHAWLGLWFGLRLRKASTATMANLVCIVAVPCSVLLLVLLFLVASMTVFNPAFFTALAGSWIVLGCTASAYCFRYAEEKLDISFRVTASHSYETPLTSAS